MHNFTIPYIFSAEAILPRKRKSTLIPVRGDVEIVIKEINKNEVKPSFVYEKTTIYTVDGSLWEPVYMRDSTEPLTITTIKNFIDNNYNKYKWSSSSAEAPFFNFWQDFNSRHELRMLDLDDCKERKSDVVSRVREYLSDDEELVIAKAKDIASNIIVCDGIVYKPSLEPYYQCYTFGLGGNHGGTALMINNLKQGSLLTEEYMFPADQYNSAIEYAKKVAIQRGDTHYVEYLNIEPIKVLEPKSVTLKTVSSLLEEDLTDTEVFSLFLEGYIKPDEAAKILWNFFGDVPIGGDEISDDSIDIDWLDFERGTDRFEIWEWFESRFNVSVIQLQKRKRDSL